ncbi:MAG: extracellular solute-binding protein [Xanthomonadales bacterium]|nr:extracellular solute-binding protein [Xanthomonadales bacterium]
MVRALAARPHPGLREREGRSRASSTGYESLGDPRFRGRVCLRTSRKVYNQSLVAMMIERLGAEVTESRVRDWVANLAAPPFADDTQLILAVAAGQCDLGLVNTYYLGRLHAEGQATEVRPFFPPAGVHVNVSGAGVTAHAPNAGQAQAFLEWLASPAVQSDFAGLNHEYPVRPGVAPSAVVAAWGEFLPEPVHVEVAGRRQAEAVALMDRAGWR